MNKCGEETPNIASCVGNYSILATKYIIGVKIDSLPRLFPRATRDFASFLYHFDVLNNFLSYVQHVHVYGALRVGQHTE